MPEWWTYAAEDFLLFSARAYWRLFELHNAALWPVQILTLIGAVAAIVLLRSSNAMNRRLVWVLIGLVWIWVGVSFVLGAYASINWAATHLAWIWIAGGVFYIVMSCTGPAADTPSRLTGWALIAYAMLLHPFWPVLTGRALLQTEVVGTAPDPTAVSTLGLALLAGTGWRGALTLLPPMLWCAVSAATLLTLGAAQGWAMAAAPVIAAAAMFGQNR